ncbi:DUF2955 domain-containing protein [Agrilutibacter solisilvae]|uniref:DUF2955 domain-containing protein n=1 Tax=Agrilutibacter solisilvae TaxID=2763317 RepID=A0A975ASI5_9GAMM|nr:DUF2955 domain-containing protein [Lysobacter solisilvae]QSX78787.1 DUF2955 domain-containing protein [Lysobacter solisilvae]
MARAAPGRVDPGRPDETVLAARHATLRFAVAVSLAFVVCEAMTWRPTFLAPLLAGVLLVNLPGRPPFKVGAMLVVAMALAALFSWLLSTLLQHAPVVLFGAISVCLFVLFLTMLTGGPALPAILGLVCLSTVPIVAMAYPTEAGRLPLALVRGIALAMLAIWLVYAVWPRSLPRRAAPPPAAPPAPIATALAATAVVVPMMLVFLLFAPTQAMAVLIGTVLLVANFDLQRSQQDAVRRVLANAAGGVTGQGAYWVLLMGPSLLTLGLILFALGIVIGARFARGDPNAAALTVGCNAMLIILSSAIAAGPGDPGQWMTRVMQFALAGLFAVGAMQLVWHRTKPAARQPG